MLKLRLRYSLAGLVASGIFLAAALAVFAWIFFVASRNPADSGESGILLLPFALPWLMWLPDSLVGPMSGVLSIVFNSILLYLVFGGLRTGR